MNFEYFEDIQFHREPGVNKRRMDGVQWMEVTLGGADGSWHHNRSRRHLLESQPSGFSILAQKIWTIGLNYGTLIYGNLRSPNGSGSLDRGGKL